MSDSLLSFTEEELAEFTGEATTTIHVVEEPAPVVRERVTVRAASVGRTYLMVPPDKWTWEHLRDYVVTKITEIHGPFPRNEKQEFGIFKGFVKRNAHLAGPIAKFAFEQVDGLWRGSPVGVTRFTEGNQEYFADPIIERLSSAS
jgi:hypothetical protein